MSPSSGRCPGLSEEGREGKGTGTLVSGGCLIIYWWTQSPNCDDRGDEEGQGGETRFRIRENGNENL